MIELFVVFTRGGFVLFSSSSGKPLEGNPVARLVSEQLVEERAASADFRADPYSLKWKLDNQRDIVYVVVTRTVLNIGYAGKLLESCAKRFSQLVDTQRGNMEMKYDFEQTYRAVLAKAEARVEAARPMRSFDVTAKKKPETIIAPPSPATSLGEKTATTSGEGAQEEEEEEDEDETDAQADEATSIADSAGDTKLSQDEIRKRILARKAAKGGKLKKSPSQSAAAPKTKAMRTWGVESGGKVTKQKADALNIKKFSDSLDESVAKGSQRVHNFKLEDIEVSSDEEEQESGSAEPTKRGFFGNLLRGLTGRELDAADLEPVLHDLQDHLIRKNVASDVSKQLCSSVQSSLMGKHLGSLSSVQTTVQEALRVALTKILTPKRKVDILRDVELANADNRPYSVVFVGINGVGKSTNLAKVASWLVSNEKKVLIAACDTFRSGAVEQLAVHCRNLDLPLFQQGYGHDAASIAQYALAQAKKDRQHVVLIDTAGRMQDNEPLMQALAKLVSVNRPDLILFVGEALAGNDSVDQLTKFNQALIDHSGATDNPRTVDGIMLSKFDTVDDQVGTAVSLVYSSGLPIVFLGTGQHYSDLKKLNVEAVVKALLK